ncbi:hypothetical protein E4U58_002868 [Claviceps cyperi]|nr:hypothetical protein E4U58_002868 [Claviceps cyperi]
MDDIITAKWAPILQILMEASKSKIGSICLLMFPLLGVTLTIIAVMCTSMRMSYAFARDHGLPFGSFLARVHPTLEVPLNALLWTVGWVIVFGCIFLGCSSSFNAILSAAVTGVVGAIITTVLFIFPPQVPVTAQNMNYCILALVIMVAIASTTWVLDGRKRYEGPQLGHIQETKLSGGSSNKDGAYSYTEKMDKTGNEASVYIFR